MTSVTLPLTGVDCHDHNPAAGDFLPSRFIRILWPRSAQALILADERLSEPGTPFSLHGGDKKVSRETLLLILRTAQEN